MKSDISSVWPVFSKNNQVSLTIGQILGTIAYNTGWLKSIDSARIMIGPTDSGKMS